jgi:hypothetical protein
MITIERLKEVLYIRLLESQAERSLQAAERDVVLGPELVEAKHLRGSANREHDGDPIDVGLFGITVKGPLARCSEL